MHQQEERSEDPQPGSRTDSQRRGSGQLTSLNSVSSRAKPGEIGGSWNDSRRPRELRALRDPPTLSDSLELLRLSLRYSDWRRPLKTSAMALVAGTPQRRGSAAGAQRRGGSVAYTPVAAVGSGWHFIS